MTIQVDITEKDLIQKLVMCVSWLNHYDSAMYFDKIDTEKYYTKLSDLSKQIEASGHYQEIYDDLHHIEKMFVKLF